MLQSKPQDEEFTILPAEENHKTKTKFERETRSKTSVANIQEESKDSINLNIDENRRTIFKTPK